jgi:dye decolorizing peroxidase
MRKRKKFLAVVVASGIFAAGGFTAIKLQQPPNIATAVEPFYGENQNGVEVERQAHATYLALDIRESTDRAAVGRMMRVLTSDAALLTQGRGLIGDSQFEMAEFPARLTVTFGFGYSLFEKIDLESAWPIREKAIPKFSIDKLEKAWSDGDLLIQVAGDEPTSIFHAVHQLARSASPFASIRWQQRGFLNSPGVNVGNQTRNLFGQIDGTANAKIDSDEFDERTWSNSPKSFVGGSTMVIRRIRFDLGTWDHLSTSKKDAVIGRTLKDGKPLGGGSLTDKAVPKDAHARLAFTDNNQGITRRSFNYDDNYLPNGTHDVGLIFTSFQSELGRFTKIQETLARFDSLNQWATPVGSALFIIPPGVKEGDWVGSSLLG